MVVVLVKNQVYRFFASHISLDDTSLLTILNIVKYALLNKANKSLIE